MGLVAYPDQSNSVLAPSSTTTDSGVLFGFQAKSIRIVNDRATAVYLNLNSTVISTGGYKTCSQEALSFDGLQCSGLAVASTTTSTSTFVRVLALGG